MTENTASYRKVMKATSIFGGVQFILILVSIVRSKLIALLLGATGLGILGLFTTSINLIASCTNFGLATSAVRDVSAANSSGNNEKVASIIAVLNRWIWITGLLGTLVVILMSSILSEFAFENQTYVGSFILISFSLLFSQLNAGQLVILQGLQKIKYLAKASIIGGVLGLLVTIPFYYYMKIDGIALAFLISTVFSYIISRFFTYKIHLVPVKISTKETFSEGKKMLKMGFMISLGGLLVVANSYLIQIYISKTGGVSEVGYFMAGFAIINTYVGLIFNAMSTDYFPRLSAVSHSNELCKMNINQQAEIAILILGPVLIGFLVFAKWIILFLYASNFLVIEEMLRWAALGIFFKSTSWALGYLLLAKGNSKLFFWSELLASIYVLLLNIAGYYFYGLEGLGISFVVAYLLYLIQIYIIGKVYYEFAFSKFLINAFIIQFFTAVCCFIAVKNIISPYSFIVGVLIMLVSCYHSLLELNKRLDIKKLIKSRLFK